MCAFKVDAKSDNNNDSHKINVEVIPSKSKRKMIYIKAKEDFVDFIFGFLTIPLGFILKLLGGNSCVGCVDNLYNSVEHLDKRWSTNSRSILMDPSVTHQFYCPKHPFKVSWSKPLKFSYSIDGKSLFIHPSISYCNRLVDPKAPNG